MNTLMLSSAGLTAQTNVLAALDADLANQQSVGFLALMPATAVWAATPLERVGAAGAAPIAAAVPLSVAAVTQRNLAPSAYETTGNPLDAALATDAFFVVQTAQGIAYTRAGAFAVSPNGLLVTGSGNPVLATNGAPIRLPVDAAVAIDATGAVSANGQSVATLQQVRLTGTITALGGSLYTGTAIPVVGGLVVPGALNTSNVALTQTLAALTRAQALYGANASAWHVAMQIRQQGDQLAQLP